MLKVPENFVFLENFCPGSVKFSQFWVKFLLSFGNKIAQFFENLNQKRRFSSKNGKIRDFSAIIRTSQNLKISYFSVSAIFLSFAKNRRSVLVQIFQKAYLFIFVRKFW